MKAENMISVLQYLQYVETKCKLQFGTDKLSQLPY